MQTELQKKEKDLLYKKQLLMNEVNKIDLELKSIQTELNTYVETKEISPELKPKDNNDILSLLRNIDEDDDFIFDSFAKPKNTKIINLPIEPKPPKEAKVPSSSPEITISDTLDKFTFLDITYDIKKIDEILIKVCEILISKYPFKVANFTNFTNFTNDNQIKIDDINFSFNELDIKSQKHRLSNGMWVKINNDCDNIINISNTLLEICGYTN